MQLSEAPPQEETGSGSWKSRNERDKCDDLHENTRNVAVYTQLHTMSTQAMHFPRQKRRHDAPVASSLDVGNVGLLANDPIVIQRCYTRHRWSERTIRDPQDRRN